MILTECLWICGGDKSTGIFIRKIKGKKIIRKILSDEKKSAYFLYQEKRRT